MTDYTRRLGESQENYELRVLHGRRLGAILVPPDPTLPVLPTPTEAEVLALPASLDLRQWCSPIKDQGSLGDCVGNCWSSGFEWLQKKLEPSVYFAGSRLALYKWARDLDGTTGDVGTTDQSMNQIVTQTGVPHESLWPYDISQFDVEPPASVKTDAAKAKATASSTVGGDVNSIKAALNKPVPVMYTFNVYNGFENAGSDGRIAMPSGSVLGGHCNLLVGYNDSFGNLDGSAGAFITQNSWGTSWGASGFGYMPYGYSTGGYIGSCYVVTAESEISVSPAPAPTPTPGGETPVMYGPITATGGCNVNAMVRVREFQPRVR